MSPTLAGGFLTTAPPGKPKVVFWNVNIFHTPGLRLKEIYLYNSWNLRKYSYLSVSFPLYYQYYVPLNMLFPLTWIITEFLIAWALFQVTLLSLWSSEIQMLQINYLGVELNPVLLAVFRPRQHPYQKLPLNPQVIISSIGLPEGGCQDTLVTICLGKSSACYSSGRIWHSEEIFI